MRLLFRAGIKSPPPPSSKPPKNNSRTNLAFTLWKIFGFAFFFLSHWICDSLVLDFEQSHAGSLWTRRRGRIEEIHLFKDVVPRLQTFGIFASWKRRVELNILLSECRKIVRIVLLNYFLKYICKCTLNVYLKEIRKYILITSKGRVH